MSLRPRSRSFVVLRRALATVLVGVVILLGVSACLTRGGAGAGDAAGPMVTLAGATANQGTAAVPPRRCAFAILVAIPERRAEPLLVAGAPVAWRADDERLPDGTTGEALERPPRDGGRAIV